MKSFAQEYTVHNGRAEPALSDIRVLNSILLSRSFREDHYFVPRAVLGAEDTVDVGPDWTELRAKSGCETMSRRRSQ